MTILMHCPAPASPFRRIVRRVTSSLLILIAGLAFVPGARAQATTAFCFGDGTSTVPGGNCPCGVAQNGLPGEGCLNSTGSGGVLTASGAPCVTCGVDTLSLSASGLPPTTTGILIQSGTQIPDVYFGDGIRCLGGNILRLYVQNAVAGSIKFPPGGAPSISARSAALLDTIPPGATRHYQVYYRDPSPAFCPPATYNITSGVSVVWR